VLIAVGARRWLLGPEPGWPFVMAYPAVVLAGAVFDRGTGIYATALSAALGAYFFMPQLDPLAVAEERDTAGLLVFLATAGLIAVILEGMHTAFSRLAEAQKELERSYTAMRGANNRLAKAEQQTKTLLHETIHRFRNDLQRLSGTVAMQMMAASEPAVRSALAEVEARIIALGSIKARLDATLTPRAEPRSSKAKPSCPGSSRTGRRWLGRTRSRSR
jgi:K+-sensing histidine kinase KdpD